MYAQREDMGHAFLKILCAHSTSSLIIWDTSRAVLIRCVCTHTHASLTENRVQQGYHTHLHQGKAAVGSCT